MPESLTHVSKVARILDRTPVIEVGEIFNGSVQDVFDSSYARVYVVDDDMAQADRTVLREAGAIESRERPANMEILQRFAVALNL